MKLVWAHLIWYVTIPLTWLVLLSTFLYSPYVRDWFAGKQKTLSIFVWSDIISHDLIQKFEQKTGCKIYVNYYEGNDELLAKLQFSGGTGYDIIMPTHYAIQSLTERNFLQKLDPAKLTFLTDINPKFLTHEPIYALPFVWELYGLVINTTFFTDTQQPTSWHALFKPSGYRVGMTDEPREITHLATQYLFGNTTQLTPDQVDTIKLLLIQQKKSVEAYTDLNLGALLASGTCPVVLAPSSMAYRAFKLLKNMQFILPQEGSLIALENIALAAHSTNQELAYQFINFLFEPENLTRIYQEYGYVPTRDSVLKTINLEYLGLPANKIQEFLDKTSFITPLLPRPELYTLWLAVKAY